MRADQRCFAQASIARPRRRLRGDRRGGDAHCSPAFVGVELVVALAEGAAERWAAMTPRYRDRGGHRGRAPWSSSASSVAGVVVAIAGVRAGRRGPSNSAIRRGCGSAPEVTRGPRRARRGPGRARPAVDRGGGGRRAAASSRPARARVAGRARPAVDRGGGGRRRRPWRAKSARRARPAAHRDAGDRGELARITAAGDARGLRYPL